MAGKRAAWQQTYQAPFNKNQYASQMAKGPNSTPPIARGLLYTLGVTGVLSAWRVADGRRKGQFVALDAQGLMRLVWAE